MNPLLKFNYILNSLSISFGLGFATISNCCYVSYVQTKASDAAKAGKKKWGYNTIELDRQRMCLLFLLLAIILSFWLYFWGVMCSDCGTAKPVYLARERLLNRLEWCLNFVNICIYFIQLEKKNEEKEKETFAVWHMSMNCLDPPEVHSQFA